MKKSMGYPPSAVSYPMIHMSILGERKAEGGKRHATRLMKADQ